MKFRNFVVRQRRDRTFNTVYVICHVSQYLTNTRVSDCISNRQLMVHRDAELLQGRHGHLRAS